MGSDGQDEGEGATGGGMLATISNEMVQAQKHFFGKGPTYAKSYILDDMLIIVMRGGVTRAEQTMLEFGAQDQVRQFRQLFENEMAGRLMGMIERITHRKVATYQSQMMFNPNVVVEMFIFDAPGDDAAIAATAQGQLDGDDTGQATDEGSLDAAGESGQSNE